MTLTLITPIVGTQFRPPSALLLRVLPSNHPLTLVSEPSNEHDQDAIRVMLDLHTLDLDSEPIANIIQNAHLSNQEAIDNWVNHHTFHLGYIASSRNHRSCQIDNRPSPGNTEIINALTHNKEIPHSPVVWIKPAFLTFSMSGQPLAKVELP